MLRSSLDRHRGFTSRTHAGDSADPLLIVRVAARDLPAFEQLYRSYHPRLTRFLERMNASAGAVDEVINDTMLVVWNRAQTYNHQCKVSTWIFAIAYRKTLKALQHERSALADEATGEGMSPDAGPEQRAVAGETRSVLARAMAGLSCEHRAVLTLTYFAGMGYREIAEIVDCPVDTVKTRMFHARRRVREILAGELGDWL